MIFLLWALFIYKFNQFIIDALDTCSIKQSGDADSPRKKCQTGLPWCSGSGENTKWDRKFGIRYLRLQWIDFKATHSREAKCIKDVEGISSSLPSPVCGSRRPTSQRWSKSPPSVMQRWSRLSSRTRTPKIEDLRKHQVCRWTNPKKMVSTEQYCIQTEWLAVLLRDYGCGLGAWMLSNLGKLGYDYVKERMTKWIRFAAISPPPCFAWRLVEHILQLPNYTCI